MASFYFDDFPKVSYDIKKNGKVENVTNIMLRYKFNAVIKNFVSPYYDYTIQDGDRADIVAFNEYDDYTLDWLIYMVNDIIDDNIKHTVLAECIFVTHNHKMHQYNVENNTKGEEYLWQPGKQETKTSQYGNENIRYNRFYKSKYINQFKELHNSVIPWNTIRYIF